MEVEGMRRSESVISFGPEDLKGVNLPHNDALVIQARVANYDIMRVFVDSGNSVNIIFREAFAQIDLQGYQLESVETTIFGFAGHAIYPEGEIVLPLTLGTGELKKTVMAIFTVVDAPSSYNIILGRPTMNELRSVASTYHQKIKFPVGGRSKTKREGKKARIDEIGGRVLEKGEVHFVAKEEQEIVEVGPGIYRDLTPDIGASFKYSPGISPGKAKEDALGPEKDKVIGEQVRDLLKAGHNREIQFSTRLSNVVLVPKSTGKWRMCVDFRELNKSCPKDHYPLPRIDQLVDSTSGCDLLSFMDAYQGYHQIPLAKDDQDKASFITSGGTFCYKVIPFGLKNAGAIYQRLMNKVFEMQLGRNVEVYVDDILGKSKEVVDFNADLEETFATLRHYGIKLTLPSVSLV
ncbi:uncharacterized protein LOC142541868 [Primulina tabacum]|uniref:uncharacterized protein LOC142541868 n=1 Tax=Primulina tabacum TaxID=48773 RepID=UPI003F59DA44